MLDMRLDVVGTPGGSPGRSAGTCVRPVHHGRHLIDVDRRCPGRHGGLADRDEACRRRDRTSEARRRRPQSMKTELILARPSQASGLRNAGRVRPVDVAGMRRVRGFPRIGVLCSSGPGDERALRPGDDGLLIHVQFSRDPPRCRDVRRFAPQLSAAGRGAVPGVIRGFNVEPIAAHHRIPPIPGAFQSPSVQPGEFGDPGVEREIMRSAECS